MSLKRMANYDWLQKYYAAFKISYYYRYEETEENIYNMSYKKIRIQNYMYIVAPKRCQGILVNSKECCSYFKFLKETAMLNICWTKSSN